MGTKNRTVCDSDGRTPPLVVTSEFVLSFAKSLADFKINKIRRDCVTLFYMDNPRRTQLLRTTARQSDDQRIHLAQHGREQGRGFSTSSSTRMPDEVQA
jgi:hypothetical protein